MSRREIREQIFKLLFRVEFNEEYEMTEQKELFFEIEEEEVSFSTKEVAEISAKFDAIKEKLPEIDALINEKATGWSTGRMGKVDLTILRLAVYELCYDDSIPEGVAINEAVEIAKKYGQKDSSSFVNGVLAKFTQKAE